MIHTGDCIEVMRTLPADSVDAVVTDPPAGVHFMSKNWDHDKGGRTEWVAWMTEVMRECYRVLKPGGYAVVWSLPRTCHWTAWAMEDAGFIIRDQLAHIFASGFPKGKAQLKPAREDWWLARKPGPLRPLGIDECRIEYAGPADFEATVSEQSGPRSWKRVKTQSTSIDLPPTGTVSANPQGRWPSNLLLSDPELFDEPNPYVVGSGATAHVNPPGQRSTSNHTPAGDFGLGPRIPYGYDTDGGYSRFFRIPSHEADTSQGDAGDGQSPAEASQNAAPAGEHVSPGDYPTHFIVPKADRSDREPIVRGQLAERSAGVTGRRSVEPGEYDEPVHPAPVGLGAWLKAQRIAAGYTRQTLAPLLSGHKNLESAAANVSNWEHEFNRPTPDQWRTLRSVLGFDDRYDEVMTTTRKVDRELFDDRPPPQRENAHPTVKPTDLMRHLVRLVTPSGGTVLDPFLGSGSTAIACELEGFPWIGIEKDASYVAIAEARLNGTQRGLGLDVPAPTKRRSVPSDDKLAELGKTYPRRGWMPDFKTDKPEEAA